MGNVVLCRGTQIGANCRIDYHVFVGEGTSIGEYCVLEYGARIYDGVRVSDCATVSGFIANGCQIGSQSIVQGQLVHRFADVSIEDVEPSPIVGEACFVGMGSLIVGPIRIADRTYVAAGAIVTQSTRAGMMYRGAPANEVGTAPLAYREGTAAFNRVSMERIHESIRRGSWA
jgi:UDP-3-O-[3-hydroxymyristoyl] glucosamine N-acyltransferase